MYEKRSFTNLFRVCVHLIFLKEWYSRISDIIFVVMNYKFGLSNFPDISILFAS